MKKVYYFIENDNRAIIGYSENYMNGSIEMDVSNSLEMLDPDVFNHYFINEKHEFVKMTDEEFNELRPYYYKPILSDAQILKAQNEVLQKKNEQLEDCIVEMASIIYK
jgi:hypothetical protein